MPECPKSRFSVALGMNCGSFEALLLSGRRFGQISTLPLERQTCVGGCQFTAIYRRVVGCRSGVILEMRVCKNWNIYMHNIISKHETRRKLGCELCMRIFFQNMEALWTPTPKTPDSWQKVRVAENFSEIDQIWAQNVERTHFLVVAIL